MEITYTLDAYKELKKNSLLLMFQRHLLRQKSGSFSFQAMLMIWQFPEIMCMARQVITIKSLSCLMSPLQRHQARRQVTIFQQIQTQTLLLCQALCCPLAALTVLLPANWQYWISQHQHLRPYLAREKLGTQYSGFGWIVQITSTWSVTKQIVNFNDGIFQRQPARLKILFSILIQML